MRYVLMDFISIWRIIIMLGFLFIDKFKEILIRNLLFVSAFYDKLNFFVTIITFIAQQQQ